MPSRAVYPTVPSYIPYLLPTEDIFFGPDHVTNPLSSHPHPHSNSYSYYSTHTPTHHTPLPQALGAATYKLPFGHHGGNHPIRFQPTGRCEISAQNHNYAVKGGELPRDVAVTHVNLNDGTCAGLMCPSRMCMSIQYHQEASPGPHDADVCFDMFIDMVRMHKKGEKGMSEGMKAVQETMLA